MNFRTIRPFLLRGRFLLLLLSLLAVSVVLFDRLCKPAPQTTRSYKIIEALNELCEADPALTVGFEKVGNEYLDESFELEEHFLRNNPMAAVLERLAYAIQRETDYDCKVGSDQIVVFPKASDQNPIMPVSLLPIQPIDANKAPLGEVVQKITTVEGTKVFIPMIGLESLTQEPMTTLKTPVTLQTPASPCHIVLAQIAEQLGARRWTATYIGPFDFMPTGSSPKKVMLSILQFF